ncbi:hypothetical protein M0Q97_12935 [Candidatus Dojkabacteria bacterium]|jgi:hypothetical protein|nr:hypothetical protein [Candidatus Dojkabacteria bacterium]
MENKLFKNRLLAIFISTNLLMLFYTCVILNVLEKQEKNIYEIKYVIIEPKEKTDWDFFIEALIWKESRGNDTVIGKYDNANSVGCLQITPIYVAEVNRILGNDVYTLEDRLSRDKSIEMFNIIQNYYNPELDLERAIKLHNPGASLDYYGEIVNKYVELKYED